MYLQTYLNGTQLYNYFLQILFDKLKILQWK